MLLLLPAAIKGSRKPGEGSWCRELSIRPTVEGVPFFASAYESPMSFPKEPLTACVKGREGRVPLQERAWAPMPLRVKGRPHFP